MEMLKLKNGSEEAKPVVAVTRLAIETLPPIAAYELVEMCRDHNHKPWGKTGEDLKTFSLASEGPPGEWHVHESIRNIVLSAAEGEGLEMVIGNPIAHNPKP